MNKAIPDKKLDPIFHDLNGVFDKMYNYIPNVDSEMVYKIEVKRTMKIYGFMTFLGLLMILTVILYST